MTEEKYSEELVSILLQAALTVSGSPGSYLIKPIGRRQETGWDAEVELDIFPFYMQFKKPSAHTGRSSPLITQRKALGASIESPILYFYLRKQAKTQPMSQHNALFALSKSKKAAYVCPLFLEESLYQASIQATIAEAVQSWVSGFPFYYWKLGQIEVRGTSQGSLRFDNIPIFREHVSIPPDKEIEEPEKHRYSFTSRGEEICFHSPERSQSGKLLGHWLQEIYETSRTDSFSCKNKAELQNITSLLDRFGLEFTIPDEVSVATWIDFGIKLEDALGIRQFAIIRPRRT